MHLLPAHNGQTELTAAYLQRQARSLYWRGWPLAEIQRELGIEKYQTLASWKRRGKWDDANPRQIIEDRIEAKIASYLDRDDFNEGHMKRVDFLMRMMERSARIGKYETSGKEGDLNPKIARRNDDAANAKREEKRKNALTRQHWQALLDDFHEKNFDYQEGWWDQRTQRTRKILKSRQIGATWYFAREAVAKIAEAVLAGEQPRNQIFLSASERQALKFRREIVGWVRRVTGVDLTGKIILFDFGNLIDDAGEPLALDQVGLYPISTNSNTAQGESGDFYFDEFFWVHGFAQLRKVAAAMATHKIYKRTYFSTPSTKTHEAYAFWSGEEWNAGKSKARQRAFDTSHKHLKTGAIMPDGSWCQVVTLEDAIAGGLGALVDIEELRAEASEDEFRNLYECEFVDDTASSFPWARLAPARVDTFFKWRDFQPALLDIPGGRPFGDSPVWIGYDPNKQGRDDAALAVVAPPLQPGTHVFEEWDLAELRDYFDWTPFFRAWELHGTYPKILDDDVVGESARSLKADADAMLDRIVAEKWFTARGVAGLWPCARHGDDVVLHDADGETHTVLPFLRQQVKKSRERANMCLADFIDPAGDWLGGFAVGIHGIEEHSKRFLADKDDYSDILLKALADRFAEAFAERLHQHVRTDLWGYAPQEQLTNAALIKEEYRGIRPAPGYPACPDHSLKPILFDLLDAEANTGISLTENFAMYPTSAVSGFYFGHPEAQYFGVARIGRDQLEDYAARRNVDIATAERWLRPNLD